MFSKVCSLLLVLGVGLTAVPVSAEVVDFPDFAVGVSEADFKSLKHGYLCTVVHHAGSEIVTYCDGAAKALFRDFPFNTGTVVIARTEANGEMYTVSNEAVTENGGKLTIRRYLPNGFYEAGGKHYFVEGLRKVRLTKRNAYQQILAVAQLGYYTTPSDGDVIRMGIIPMNQADFDSLTGGGSLLRGRFRGEVIMNVDNGGALYYLPQDIPLSPRPISAVMSKAEVFHLVERFSRPTKRSVISSLTSYRFE